MPGAQTNVQICIFFFFQAEDGIRDADVTGVQTCALPICGGRPLCILDLGLPRDVEPAIAQLENVFLYDIDDLQAVAAQAAVERRRDIPAAERIVSEEVERFWAWYGGLVVVPVLKEFRERLDQVRATELERALRRLAHLSPEDRGEIEHLSHTLLDKILHQPHPAPQQAAHG